MSTPVEEEQIPTRAWWALFVSTLVVFLAVINISSVNVSFPSIRDDLNASEQALGWVVSVYNLAIGSLLLVAGRLADSLGRRRVYLPGVAVFAVGSLVCTVAPGVEWLIAGRVIQGIGGSVTIAAGFAVMLPEFPPNRRSTPIGIAGAAGGLGAVVGPVVGSVVIDAFSWRGVFALNLPFCLLVLVLGPRLLSESRDPDATGRIDWLSVALGTVGVGCFMFAITQTSAWGLFDSRVVGLIVVATVLVVMLVRRSLHVAEPLIDLELFRFASFTSAIIGATLYGLAFASGPLVSSIFLQEVWDLPIRDVGLVLAISPLMSVAASPIVGRLADRIGHRWILTVGCSLLAIANAGFAVLLDGTVRPWSLYVPISVIAGVGVGMTIATWSSAAVADIPPARFAISGATFNTLRQAAFGLGIAIVVALIAASGEGTTLVGTQRAYSFVAATFLLSAVAVGATFPSGSARDRSAASATRTPKPN